MPEVSQDQKERLLPIGRIAKKGQVALAISAETDLSAAIQFTDIDPAVLDLILGRFDVTSIEGVTVADWVTTMVNGNGWEDRVVP